MFIDFNLYGAYYNLRKHKTKIKENNYRGGSDTFTTYFQTFESESQGITTSRLNKYFVFKLEIEYFQNSHIFKVKDQHSMGSLFSVINLMFFKVPNFVLQILIFMSLIWDREGRRIKIKHIISSLR